MNNLFATPCVKEQALYPSPHHHISKSTEQGTLVADYIVCRQAHLDGHASAVEGLGEQHLLATQAMKG